MVQREMDKIKIDLPIDRIANLCRRYQVRELSIFGSAVRQDFRSDSDVDFLVIFENDDYGPWMGKLTDMEAELAALLGRPVDLVPKDQLKWVIQEEALREAKVIYDAA